MFSKLCVLAVVIPFISALTLNAPKEAVTSSGPITLTWSSDSNDQPSFSLELVNEQFHDTFAIANNVPTGMGEISLVLPSVPINREYTIAAVNISDVHDVLSTTPPFNIGAPASSSEASSSTTTGSGSGNSSGHSGPSISAMPPVSSSSFGVTRTNPATGTTSPTNAAAASSNANAPTGTNFGNSGLPVRLNVNKGFIVSAALSLVAGAAIVAL